MKVITNNKRFNIDISFDWINLYRGFYVIPTIIFYYSNDYYSKAFQFSFRFLNISILTRIFYLYNKITK